MNAKQKRRFKPLFGYVLLRKLSQDKTEGGLYVPDTAQDSVVRWKVIESSEGYADNGVRVPSSLKEGDEVFVTSRIAIGVDSRTGKEIKREIVQTYHRADMPDDEHMARLADCMGVSAGSGSVH